MRTPPATRNRVTKLMSRWRNGWDVARAEPKLAANALAAFARSCAVAPKDPQILIGTHHKVLTVFMGRVFKSFALLTNRSISVGMAEQVDYSADILLDHHSQFDFSRLDRNFVGMHFRRDPRDLIVSAGFYHKRSDEPQLHVPREEFGGKTYAQYISAMDSMEEVFLFELDHSAGMNIRQMLAWNYNNGGFTELKYEELVTPDGGRMFRKAIDAWPLSSIEKSLLESLFEHYSLFGGKARKLGHVRDPRSKQFQEHFTDRLYREFETRFGNAAQQLGYD